MKRYYYIICMLTMLIADTIIFGVTILKAAPFQPDVAYKQIDSLAQCSACFNNFQVREVICGVIGWTDLGSAQDQILNLNEDELKCYRRRIISFSKT